MSNIIDVNFFVEFINLTDYKVYKEISNYFIHENVFITRKDLKKKPNAVKIEPTSIEYEEVVSGWLNRNRNILSQPELFFGFIDYLVNKNVADTKIAYFILANFPSKKDENREEKVDLILRRLSNHQNVFKCVYKNKNFWQINNLEDRVNKVWSYCNKNQNVLLELLNLVSMSSSFKDVEEQKRLYKFYRENADNFQEIEPIFTKIKDNKEKLVYKTNELELLVFKFDNVNFSAFMVDSDVNVNYLLGNLKMSFEILKKHCGLEELTVCNENNKTEIRLIGSNIKNDVGFYHKFFNKTLSFMKETMSNFPNTQGDSNNKVNYMDQYSKSMIKDLILEVEKECLLEKLGDVTRANVSKVKNKI